MAVRNGHKQLLEKRRGQEMHNVHKNMGNNRTFKKVSESVRRRNYIRQNFGRRWKRKEGDEENSRKKKRNKRHNKSGLAG